MCRVSAMRHLIICSLFIAFYEISSISARGLTRQTRDYPLKYGGSGRDISSSPIEDIDSNGNLELAEKKKLPRGSKHDTLHNLQKSILIALEKLYGAYKQVSDQLRGGETPLKAEGQSEDDYPNIRRDPTKKIDNDDNLEHTVKKQLAKGSSKNEKQNKLNKAYMTELSVSRPGDQSWETSRQQEEDDYPNTRGDPKEKLDIDGNLEQAKKRKFTKGSNRNEELKKLYEAYMTESSESRRSNHPPEATRRGLIDTGISMVGSAVGNVLGSMLGNKAPPVVRPPYVNPNTPPPMIKGKNLNYLKERDRAVGLGILGNFHLGSEVNAKHESMSHIVANVPAVGWSAY